METVTKKLYEGMFLIDSIIAASDFDGVMDAIKTVLERSDCEIVSINKWDERKLAYPVQKKTRGTYILTYFRTEGANISNIERDVQLSEKIMRVLILSTEQMSKEDIQKETPAMASKRKEKEYAEAQAQKAKEQEEAQAAAAVAEEQQTPPDADQSVEVEESEEVAEVVESAEVAVADETQNDTAEKEETAPADDESDKAEKIVDQTQDNTAKEDNPEKELD